MNWHRTMFKLKYSFGGIRMKLKKMSVNSVKSFFMLGTEKFVSGFIVNQGIEMSTGVLENKEII